jgi:hypothetical protein
MSAQIQTYVASEHGAVLDADIETGGGTDDTAALQAILDRARDGDPVRLVLDGVARVTGLDLYGDTTIEGGDGAGLYLADDSDRAILRNAHRTRGDVVDERIVVRGCVLNGNRLGQREPYRGAPRSGEAGVRVEGAPHLDADHTLKAPVQFFGVRDLTIERVVIRNPRTFTLWLANVADVVIRRVTIDAEYGRYPTEGSREEQAAFLDSHDRSNIDGIHINGPAHHILIEDVVLTTEDDAISLCANDWGVVDLTVEDLHGPYVAQGPITDVVVRGVELVDVSHAIRLFSANQRIDRIRMEGITGTVRERAVMISHFAVPDHLGDFGSVSFQGVDLVAVPSISIGDRYPQLLTEEVRHTAGAEEAESPFFAINSPIERLELRDVTITPVDARPLLRIGPHARIDSLVADIAVASVPGTTSPIRAIPGARLGDVQLDVRTS